MSLLRLIFCFALLISSGQLVSAEEELQSIRGETMGTTYNIKWIGASDSASDLQQKVDSRLVEINRLMSTYDPDSELSKFNQYDQTDWFPVSEETATVVAKALEISELSGGAFDPTVGRLVRLWNFGPDAAAPQAPSQEEIATALKSVGHQFIQVQTKPPAISKSMGTVELDLSAIAKGYGVDQIVQLLKSESIENCMVEIGGEVLSLIHI